MEGRFRKGEKTLDKAAKERVKEMHKRYKQNPVNIVKSRLLDKPTLIQSIDEILAIEEKIKQSIKRKLERKK